MENANKKLGDRIKEFRNKEGLSQEDISKKLGINRSTYSNYENNIREPKIEILNKIADALNISIYDLIRDTPESKSIKREINKQTSLEIMDIIKGMHDGIVKDTNDLLLIKPLDDRIRDMLYHTMNLLADSSTRALVYNKLDHLFENFANVLGNLDNLQVNGNNDDIMPILQNISAYLEERKLLSDKLIQANKIISNKTTKEGE